MVLARNRLLPFSQQYQDSNFASAVRNIDLLTRELQERMMATRMEPISQVWMKFPRMLRDISKELGKIRVLVTIFNLFMDSKYCARQGST
jgi:two-component system chemotaxis sensor kinase CheA